MGAVVSDSAAHAVRRPAATARAAIAGDPPGHCHLSNQASGTKSSPSRHGRGHAHPALRLSRQFDYSSTLPGVTFRIMWALGRMALS